ncbi:MAG: M48 family metalloprotease [Moraxella sp.]|nr:M48 family metalloprotease [Moraxella sp.]
MTFIRFSIRFFAFRQSALMLTLSLGLGGLGISQASHANYTAAPIRAGFSETHINRLIAEWSLQQVNGGMPQIHDPWVVDTIYRITNQMNVSVRSQSLIATPVINDNSINAFAVPGGLIAINTGTILSSKSLDEPVSVLAHEVAHLSQRHYEHTKDEKGKLLAMQVGGFVAALAAAVAGSGDAALAMMAGSQTAAADTAAAGSREHEREADRVGMQILANNGYDARAMPRFFGRLHQQTQLNQYDGAFIPSFVRSHPFTTERLSEATARANSHPAVSALAKQQQAISFDMLYWRLQYLSKQATFTELSAAAKHSTGAKLALAAWLSDHARFDDAKALLTQLNALPSTNKQSLEPLLCITNAHVYYQQKAYNQALEHIESCQRVYPERRDLKIYLADTLIYAGRPIEAQALLKPLTDNTPHDIKAWDLTQKSYQMLANTSTDNNIRELSSIHALRSRGYVELWSARYDSALTSLTQAKNLAEQNPKYRTLAALLDKDLATVQTYKNFKP